MISCRQSTDMKKKSKINGIFSNPFQIPSICSRFGRGAHSYSHPKHDLVIQIQPTQTHLVPSLRDNFISRLLIGSMPWESSARLRSRSFPRQYRQLPVSIKSTRLSLLTSSNGLSRPADVASSMAKEENQGGYPESGDRRMSRASE